MKFLSNVAPVLSGCPLVGLQKQVLGMTLGESEIISQMCLILEPLRQLHGKQFLRCFRAEVHPPAIQNQFVFVSVFVLVHIGVVFSLYQSGSSRKEGKICIAVEIGSPFCNYLVEEAVSIKPVDHAADTTMSEPRSEEHTSELQSRLHLVCRL